MKKFGERGWGPHAEGYDGGRPEWEGCRVEGAREGSCPDVTAVWRGGRGEKLDVALLEEEVALGVGVFSSSSSFF